MEERLCCWTTCLSTGSCTSRLKRLVSRGSALVSRSLSAGNFSAFSSDASHVASTEGIGSMTDCHTSPAASPPPSPHPSCLPSLHPSLLISREEWTEWTAGSRFPPPPRTSPPSSPSSRDASPHSRISATDSASSTFTSSITGESRGRDPSLPPSRNPPPSLAQAKPSPLCAFAAASLASAPSHVASAWYSVPPPSTRRPSQ